MGFWGLLSLALGFAVALAGCGGGGSSGEPAAPPPGNGDPPAELAQRIAQAAAEVRADTCFRQADTSGCVWARYTVDATDFAMPHDSGEAVLVVDAFHGSPPLLSPRYANRLKGFLAFGPGGALTPSPGSLRLPATLLSVLRRFASPEPINARRLATLAPAIEASYGGLELGVPSHGAYVLSLLIDASPHQPFVLLDGLNLELMAHDDYCDTSGRTEVQARLLSVARTAADRLAALMREHHVRYVNYSAGHTLPVLRESWAAACGGAAPADALLREKLAAYQPLYAALFNTPGVLASHAAFPNDSAIDFPYDQPSPSFPNRLRIGYFTVLDSGLDEQGRGDTTALQASPALANVDLYVNTGVLPTRPFAYNTTPLLQTDRFGLDLQPITAPQTSWVAPLALSRLIHLRQAAFGARTFDNALIVDLADAVRPRSCPALRDGRCIYQDPLRHGQTEAVRLGYQPKLYQP